MVGHVCHHATWVWPEPYIRYAPYMTVYLMISLLKTPYIHHIYTLLACLYIRFWPTLTICDEAGLKKVLTMCKGPVNRQNQGSPQTSTACCTVSVCTCTASVSRVGQNRTYTVCVRCFWQGSHQMYGHAVYIYVSGQPYLYRTVLRSSSSTAC
jgi:hypothetical protein